MSYEDCYTKGPHVIPYNGDIVLVNQACHCRGIWRYRWIGLGEWYRNPSTPTPDSICASEKAKLEKNRGTHEVCAETIGLNVGVILTIEHIDKYLDVLIR